MVAVGLENATTTIDQVITKVGFDFCVNPRGTGKNELVRSLSVYFIHDSDFTAGRVGYQVDLFTYLLLYGFSSSSSCATNLCHKNDNWKGRKEMIETFGIRSRLFFCKQDK